MCPWTAFAGTQPDSTSTSSISSKALRRQVQAPCTSFTIDAPNAQQCQQEVESSGNCRCYFYLHETAELQGQMHQPLGSPPAAGTAQATSDCHVSNLAQMQGQEVTSTSQMRAHRQLQAWCSRTSGAHTLNSSWSRWRSAAYISGHAANWRRSRSRRSGDARPRHIACRHRGRLFISFLPV